MRLVAPILVAFLSLVLDDGIFVSCQDNATAPNETLPLDDMEILMTEGPTEDPVEIIGESLTMSPTNETTTDGSTVADVDEAGNTTGTVDGTSETEAPTMGETMAVTLIDVDDEATNTTDPDLEGTAQEPVGNVTVETDATEPPLPPPIENITSAPTETPATGDDPVPELTTAPQGAPATECAVQVSNTDPVCAQLLKFTTADCDCYNFCSGKLIACLNYGERNSFSCSGETVAGCEADQKISSASTTATSLTVIVLVAALAFV